MNKENRQTERILQKMASEIQVPDFHERFQVPKKKRFGFLQQCIPALSLCALVCALVLGLWLPNQKQQIPPLDEPSRTTYYWAGLDTQAANAEMIAAFCENQVPYILQFENKENLIYTTFIERFGQKILGIGIQFAFLTDYFYYTCKIAILSDAVIDAQKDYQNLNNQLMWNENTISYKYVGVYDDLYLYKATFKKNSFIYLIDYSSISQDFESGFETIFSKNTENT